MTITIPSGRTLPLQAKAGGGFESSGLALVEELLAGNAALGVSGASLAHGETVTVSTDGTYSFGSKPTQAPISWDMGQDLRINGVANSAHANALDGTTVGDAGVLTGNAAITTSRSLRHARINRQYSSINSDLDCNVKHDSLLSAGRASRKSYSKFHIRFPADPRYVDTAPYTALTGTFDTGVDGELGEAITIDVGGNVTQGNIINVDSVNGRIGVFSPSENLTSSSGSAVSITGNVSGATATLDFTSGYLAAPPCKLWRINQEASDGILSVVQLGVEQFWIESNLSGTDAIGMNRFTNGPGYTATANNGEFFRAELFVDWATSTDLKAELHLVGPQGHQIKTITGIDGSANYLDQAVTILTVGSDSGVDHALTVDVSEIYVDETPQRVVIGNASTYAACTELEEQYHSAWSASEISVELYQGGLDNFTGKYLFVLDADNNVIGSGVAL